MNNMKKLLIVLCTLGILMGCGTQEIKADRKSNIRWVDGSTMLDIYSFTKDDKEYLIVDRYSGGVAIIEHKTDTIGNKK